MPLQCLGFLTFGFFLSFCLCSTAPLPCSFCVCLFFALRVLCFFNLIPICEPHLHINPIGGVVRGPLFFFRYTAARCAVRPAGANPVRADFCCRDCTTNSQKCTFFRSDFAVGGARTARRPSSAARVRHGVRGTAGFRPTGKFRKF